MKLLLNEQETALFTELETSIKRLSHKRHMLTETPPVVSHCKCIDFILNNLLHCDSLIPSFCQPEHLSDLWLAEPPAPRQQLPAAQPRSAPEVSP